jgi:hypothetical protein
MDPDPSHKIVTIDVVENVEIRYCEYCSIFATHPDIEKPCKRRLDYLTELKRLEEINSPRRR